MAASDITTTIITNLLDEELIRMGARLHSADLNHQATVTLGLATADKDELAPILGDEFLETLIKVRLRVAEIAQDRTFAEEESQSKTLAQDATIRKAAQWRRKAMNLGKVLLRRGAKEAKNLAQVTSPDKTFANLGKEITDKKNLLLQLAPKAPKPAYAKSLADAGLALAADLEAKDATQEIDLKNLPKKTKDAYLHKGLLYYGLKQIIDVGNDLDDPAGTYDMGIYHRRQARREAAPKAAAAKAAKTPGAGTPAAR